MNLDLANIDRRTLLIGGGVGIGLVVGFALWPRGLPSDLSTREGEYLFGKYLKIGVDGRVTVAVPQAETGQGIWTALPQILADELGAAWDMVAVEPAPLIGNYPNPFADSEGWSDDLGATQLMSFPADARFRITAGSTSVRAFEHSLRLAGAAARGMLVSEAADRWGIDAEECETADGFVLHEGKTFSFAQLAEAAASRTPPTRPTERAGRKARLSGKALPRLDLAPKSDGSFRYAADVRLPGMLFASARMAPPGGRLTAYSKDGAKRASARDVIAGNGWIAAVADNWWLAERALKAANPHFEAPESPGRDGMRALFEQALESGESDDWFSRGDYAAAIEGSRPLAATYWVAPAQHLAIEPISATARFSGERLEVWAPTQAPELAREAAANASALKTSQITLYPMPPGEPGGRAVEADAIPIAVTLARKLNQPVQVSLSQSASQNHGPLAPAALARMTALPGAGGITAAWKMRIATSNALGASLRRLTGQEPASSLGKTALDGAVPPYGIADISIEAVPVATAFNTGYMRGHPQRATTFFVESFIDELARAAGMEPVAFRMAMLGGNPRLAACLQAATAAAGWDGGGPGSTKGIAACSAFGSNIALVADASFAADRSIEVHRLVAAVDCGRVINPQLVSQQVEAGLIWALGLANARDLDFAAGMPRSRPLGATGLPRIARTPEIEVHLMPSMASPGGVSGLAVPVLAPAIANAIYAGSGRRLRSLPFDPMTS